MANVEITDPNCAGVIFAHGSRFGGHTLFIKNQKRRAFCGCEAFDRASRVREVKFATAAPLA